jgi:crotonobetaine/carnitine-CoA ligase
MARAAIVERLLELGDAYPDDAYLKFDDETVSWSQSADRTIRAGNGFSALGVRPGERVAIMLENSPDFLFTYFGVLAVGGGTVPVNTAQRGGALQHILEDSGVSVVVTEQHLKVAVLEVAPAGVAVIVRGEPSFEELFADASSVPEMGEGETSGLGILYTSGTTGPPKGVVATGYDLSHVHALHEMFDVAPGETIYTPLPLFHGNALILSAMGAVWNRWTLALGKRFSASQFWNETRRYGAVEVNALGAMIPILLKQPPRDDDRDNPVRTVLSAACPEWAWREFEERFDVRLLEFYGLVDYPGYLVNRHSVPGKMGRPIGATEFAVVDAASNPVPAGTPGELVMRHPGGRLTHYHNNPDATDDAYREGWFHTGDLAVVDADGDFVYAGRLKESMRRRGENISAWEIETVVATHPAVKECAAHAVTSPLGEDDVKIVVVLQPGAEVMPEEIATYCVGRMAQFAVPTYVEFRGELPKTATHRVRYELLKQEGVTAETWASPSVLPSPR